MAIEDTESQYDKLARRYAALFFIWLAMVVVALSLMLAATGKIQGIGTICWFAIFPGGGLYLMLARDRLMRLRNEQ